VRPRLTWTAHSLPHRNLVTAQVSGGIVISTEQRLTHMVSLVRAVGVTLAIELFDSSDPVLAKYLIKKGVLQGPGIYSRSGPAR
jgi:hypothetical protein